jgi:predicted DNA-binding transcriptional regulator YafY
MITSQERSWLKTMMELPSASEAFTPDTLLKLQAILDTEKLINTEAIIEKARSVESQTFHPHLRSLRRFIMVGSGINMNYVSKGGKLYDNKIGLPYKLEYFMVKRSWYLLWYPLAANTLISTKLEHIQSISEFEIAEEQADKILKRIEEILEKHRQQAQLEVGRPYNPELSRILYAFSCFEKEVNYDSIKDIYTIRLTFANNEAEYVLSKLRFLGKRVRVLEGEYLKRRMLESANKALVRYGE